MKKCVILLCISLAITTACYSMESEDSENGYKSASLENIWNRDPLPNSQYAGYIPYNQPNSNYTAQQPWVYPEFVYQSANKKEIKLRLEWQKLQYKQAAFCAELLRFDKGVPVYNTNPETRDHASQYLLSWTQSLPNQ